MKKKHAAKSYFNFFLIFFIILSFSEIIPQNSNRQWKGYSILGNGKLCVVYSDDPRITKLTGCNGIQHFYFDNYSADYIASSSFALVEKNILTQTTGMKNFFTAETYIKYKDGLIQKVECFIHPKDAAVLSLKFNEEKKDVKPLFNLVLRKNILTDHTTKLTSLEVVNNIVIAEWSNGFVLGLASNSASNKIEAVDSIITAADAKNIIIAAASSKESVESKLNYLLKQKDLQSQASIYWNNWMNSGKLPRFKNGFSEAKKYLNYFKGTLYAVKSACIDGQVPADITGQFVTNNMPQLYPRDAMMCARVFLLTGHYQEAKSIISFWTRKNIPEKSDGEFYARYDANAKAVDGGSGARFNEPEWDANGYLIQLLNDFHKAKKIWLAHKSFIYKLADFLVSKIDPSGLLYEGGIVEWTGYLPSTNMTCAAALQTASVIAAEFGDKFLSKKYLNASDKISNSLHKLFDKKRKALCALRFHGVKAEGNYSITTPAKDTLYLWDTSLNFGVLWGFPNNSLVVQTNKFIEDSTCKHGGGVEYFEALDNAWLSNYGGDLFFFTTAAESQYQCLQGNYSEAKKHIDWMIYNSNSYGLMPERIYLNQSDCSEASPLSWCNAEFAASVFVFSQRYK